MNSPKKHITSFGLLIVTIWVANIAGSHFFERFDLTQDKRYTLSDAAKETLDSLDSPLLIDVFLEGNFPPEFKKLQIETKQMLQEFSADNPFIRYNFIDPFANTENPEEIRRQLASLGLIAAQVQIKENGKVSNELVYPWAVAYYKEKSVNIPLLKNQLGTTSEERVNNSIQNLEYSLADGFKKLVNSKTKKVAVLKGNGELDDRYLADFLTTLKEYYYIAPFTLDSAYNDPIRTLEELKEYDLIIAAKPTESFNDREKYILDQYTMNGGNSLWLIDATEIIDDTISEKKIAIRRELNLSDFFFKYGIRVNSNLVKDLYSAPIVLASGNENEAQYNRYPWLFSPLSASSQNHPIVTNIEAVKFDYISSIDTLPNPIHKTVLLSSSNISKIIGLPATIDFDKEIPENLNIMNNGPEPNDFSANETTFAVLLEGNFPSVFTNRIKPFEIKNDKTVSTSAKMVVISDGDIVKNQFDRNRPLELGFDKMTSIMYGNKEFLLNTVNYLLDDSGLINIRTKEIVVPFLDQTRTIEKRTKWQVINLLLPIVLLLIFGVSFKFYRKRKYAAKC